MIVSLKVWDDENGETGKIELYNRRSFTCRILFGTLKYDNKEERSTLLEMLTRNHPEVDIIPNDLTTGNFVDVYFK
ncbi:MAG: hypothetical protein A4E32_01494 [Methanomassiliicoccales archaeon PtaU1.Bin124]|nr:MAG: hypothetical protein A4E32_01494 [Methanomassiliicoccales archaeon PtaU1.Bin124]